MYDDLAMAYVFVIGMEINTMVANDLVEIH